VGIQYFWIVRCFWIPASAGMTGKKIVIEFNSKLLFGRIII